MTWEIGLVFVVIVVVFALLASEALPPDIVALSALVFVAMTGLITPAEAFLSFANEAPITVASMFILSYALQRTGLIDDLGDKLRLRPQMSEARLLLSLMVVVAGVSAFVNNTPVVVAFMPLVLGLARHHKVSASKLLIPLSFGAIFGGTCTLIGTSTNLAVSALARNDYGVTISLFDITLPGIIMALAGILYMVFVGRHLLPAREPLSTLVEDSATKHFYAEVEVGSRSRLVGRRLPQTLLGAIPDIFPKQVRRGNRVLPGGLTEGPLQAGDRIIVSGPLRALLKLQAERNLVVHNAPPGGRGR